MGFRFLRFLVYIIFGVEPGQRKVGKRNRNRISSFMELPVMVFGVLLSFSYEYFRRAKASSPGQMPDIADHLPYLVVLDEPLPPRHSAHTDAIFDDPFHLAVRVFLDLRRA